MWLNSANDIGQEYMNIEAQKGLKLSLNTSEEDEAIDKWEVPFNTDVGGCTST